jgi:hypothetical protein
MKIICCSNSLAWLNNEDFLWFFRPEGPCAILIEAHADLKQ